MDSSNSVPSAHQPSNSGAVPTTPFIPYSPQAVATPPPQHPLSPTQPVQKINSTLAIAIIGLFAGGIMLGYLLGRSSVDPGESLIASELTPTQEVIVEEEGIPSFEIIEPSSDGTLVPVTMISMGENMSFMVPEPEGCPECTVSQPMMVQVVSRPELLDTAEPQVESITDWRLSVEALDLETTPVGEDEMSSGIPTTATGVPLSVLQLMQADIEGTTPVIFTDPLTDEAVTFARSGEVMFEGVAVPVYSAQWNALGSGSHDLVIITRDAVPYVFSFEYISETQQGVLRSIIETVSMPTEEQL